MSSNMFKQNVNNPTKYRMFFNYDNDKKVYVAPMLPAKIALTVNGKLTSVDIDTFGEILHRGKRDAITIEFESIFPSQYGKNYCACMQKEFKKPSVWQRRYGRRTMPPTQKQNTRTRWYFLLAHPMTPLRNILSDKAILHLYLRSRSVFTM